MSNSDMNIRLSGLVFKREQRQGIRIVAEQIYAFAPSDSTLRLNFEQKGDQVKVTGRVASQVGVFAADAMDSCPVQAMRKLQTKLNNDFTQWKEKRFFQQEVAS